MDKMVGMAKTKPVWARPVDDAAVMAVASKYRSPVNSLSVLVLPCGLATVATAVMPRPQPILAGLPERSVAKVAMLAHTLSLWLVAELPLRSPPSR